MILQLSSYFFEIIVLYGALALFLHLIYSYVRKPKKTQLEKYHEDLKNFKIAVEEKDITHIDFYGDRLIYNQHLTQQDKRIIYQVVKGYIGTSSDINKLLNPLWAEVHYKIHGHDPLE